MQWISNQNLFAPYYESAFCYHHIVFLAPIFHDDFFLVPFSDNLCNAKICLPYFVIEVSTLGIFLEYLESVKICVICLIK